MEASAQKTLDAASEGPVIEWGGQAYEPRVLVHFDIRSAEEAVRRRVDRFLYGSRETRRVGGGQKTYRYPGLLERTDGRRFGQSVVILSPVAAEEAFLFLRGVEVLQKVEVLARLGLSPPRSDLRGSD